MSKFGDFMKDQWHGLLGTVKELKIPVLSQVATMATGLLGSHLQKSIINDKMSGAEREAFNLSAQEAQKARDWNLEMDNSKYQRQVTDMQKAGINPALAMNGGVTTQATSNAMANASTQQTPIMPIQDFATLAMNLKVQKQQEAKLKEEAEATRIQNNVERLTALRNRIAEIKQKESLTDKQIQELANLKIEEQNLIKVGKLNDKQYEIYDQTYQRMVTENKYLDEMQKQDLAIKAAEAGFAEAQLESYDWNNAKQMSLSAARNYAGNVNVTVAGAGGSYSHSDTTMGYLIFNRKQKTYTFIPASDYLKVKEPEKKPEEKKPTAKEVEKRVGEIPIDWNNQD